MMKPEPRLCRTCSRCGSPKGDCWRTLTTCFVEMFTTVCVCFLTNGAKDSGAGCADEVSEAARSANNRNRAAILNERFMMTSRGIDDYEFIARRGGSVKRFRGATGFV